MLKSHLHRHLWQRLPQAWRRLVLLHATALVGPRPTANAKPGVPILVAGALRTASGLGESARLCHDALKLAGLPVFGVDLTPALMQPEDYLDFAFVDGRTLEGVGTIVLHINSPLVPLAMLRLGRRLIHNKRIVGYWAWELPQVPADWHYGIPFVQELWVPSRFTAEAVRSIAAGRPVHIVPHPVAQHQPKLSPATEEVDHPFTALTIFNTASSFARKNPCAAIEAFRMAFDGDPSTQLIVKTSNLSAFSQGITLIESAKGSANNIVVIDKIMSASELAALYAKADVVISLHRSEGFGLTLAEAMIRGLPVVATNWSGNVDFLTEETGMPIGYRLVQAEDPQGTYHHPAMSWAEADVREAARALRRLRDDQTLSLALGRTAALFASRTWSAEAYVAAVRQHLRL